MYNDCYMKCEAIMEYARKHPRFDTEFVESVMEQIENGREPSDTQEAAVDNIIDGFRISW